ncbi:hypothetical protein SAMN05878482_11078 [Peribacillus simplex]|uniref:Uncharacterized protein n=1 Tax=Peribacillus simplex TaxID=1478 RepID=A0A9X8RDX6_9BACI|nr:hypothetical protein [Peribacillus simplex]SIS04196.1 hypothetical protein SAMN05878482_11078 [Peribacillus simplex]
MANDVLKIIQIEYNQLLNKLLPDIDNNAPVEPSKILRIIDEVKLFWYKRLPLVEFEIENWARAKECLLLSGAIYLNVKDNEHYFFTLFGDYHVVDDPLIKLEGFFRYSDVKLLDKNLIDIFKRAYFDTLEVTKNHSNLIHILPIKELVLKYYNDNNELINKFYWKFVSIILNSEVKNTSEFFDKFRALSDIEKELDEFILSNLIFIDTNDSKLSLEDRCNRYKKEYQQFEELTNLEIFNVATYSYVAQTIDILLISSFLGFTPYIRNDIAFRYFLLLKDTFIGDDEIRKVVEKSIVLYIAYKSVHLTRLTKYNFDEFIDRVKNENLMFSIFERLKSNEIEVIYSEVEPTRKIIDEEINKLL